MASGGFGPHEDDVLRVVAQAGRLPPERLPELIAFAAGNDEDPAAAVARREIARLARDPELRPRLERADDTARQWASELRYDHIVPMGGYEMGSGVDPRGRSLAARILFDALAALIAGDRLSADDHEALVGPWEAVVGPRSIPGSEGAGAPSSTAPGADGADA